MHAPPTTFDAHQLSPHSIPDPQTLTGSNTSQVVTVASLDLYALPGGTAVPPPANTSLAPSKVNSLFPVRLLRYDAVSMVERV